MPAHDSRWPQAHSATAWAACRAAALACRGRRCPRVRRVSGLARGCRGMRKARRSRRYMWTRIAASSEVAGSRGSCGSPKRDPDVRQLEPLDALDQVGQVVPPHILGNNGSRWPDHPRQPDSVIAGARADITDHHARGQPHQTCELLSLLVGIARCVRRAARAYDLGDRTLEAWKDLRRRPRRCEVADVSLLGAGGRRHQLNSGRQDHYQSARRATADHGTSRVAWGYASGRTILSMQVQGVGRIRR